MSHYEFKEEEFTTEFNGRTVWRILKQALPHWPWLVGFLLTIAFVSGMDSYFTYLGKRIVDEGILVGDRAVVGHTTELKVCLLFDEANVPHFSYVGDSIFGWKAHLGAGVKISNLKITRTPVVVTVCGVLQLAGVKVRVVGEAVPSVVSEEERPMVTLAAGSVSSTTLKESIPPASVVTSPSTGVTVMPGSGGGGGPSRHPSGHSLMPPHVSVKFVK